MLLDISKLKSTGWNPKWNSYMAVFNILLSDAGGDFKGFKRLVEIFQI